MPELQVMHRGLWSCGNTDLCRAEEFWPRVFEGKVSKMGRATVARIGDDKVRVDCTVDAAEVDSAVAEAGFIVEDLKKRPLGEKQTGADLEDTSGRAVLVRATRSVVEQAIGSAVEENKLRLTANPQVEIEELVCEGKPYSFAIELSVVPEFSLREYRSLEVKLDQRGDVTPEDIDARLEEVRSRSAEVEKDSNKPISQNDIVELSFESFIDGEAYDGSTASGYSYTLGSLYLPQPFEDGLIGMRSGESKTIEFIVPQDYGSPEVAGKKARFDVEVGRVASCTLPQIDDVFAQSFGYDSLAAWRDKLKGELEQEKDALHAEMREKAVRQALADCMVGTVDDAVIGARAESMYQAFKLDLEQQGLAYEEYCRFLGLTDAMVREEMKGEAAVLLRENLALESLFRELDLQINETEVQKTADEMAGNSGLGSRMDLGDLQPKQLDALREMTVHRMATEWLLENVTFIE